MRTPSIKTLREIFGDQAAQAKKILKMSREDLLETPEGHARFQECYNSPGTADLRLTCLNALGNFHGVESFQTSRGTCLYLNAGDTYAPTLVLFGGRYRVTSWGDIAERYATE